MIGHIKKSIPTYESCFNWNIFYNIIYNNLLNSIFLLTFNHVFVKNDLEITKTYGVFEALFCILSGMKSLWY